jgi:predicted nucleic acid-binding protein
VPHLWRAEFLKLLTLSVRRGLLQRSQAVAAWESALALFEDRQRDPEPPSVLQAALDRGLSAYDAHIVVLADQLDTRLVTADKGILLRCPGRAISLERFIQGD